MFWWADLPPGIPPGLLLGTAGFKTFLLFLVVLPYENTINHLSTYAKIYAHRYTTKYEDSYKLIVI